MWLLFPMRLKNQKSLYVLLLCFLYDFVVKATATPAPPSVSPTALTSPKQLNEDLSISAEQNYVATVFYAVKKQNLRGP
ncbi:hypothetical protein J2X69_003323 [Algoriphagus sp. 4150]|nr:hypothetical protein [Algoriphagus sp. 4150]